MPLKKLMSRGCDGLYRDPSTNIIYFRQFRKGRGELKKSLRTTDIEKAKQERDELRRLMETSAARTRALGRQAKTALELFDAWILRKEDQNKSPATITSIKASRKHLAPYLEMMHPEDISAEWWESIYVREIKSRTHKDRKFANDRKWLGGFLRQCLDDGFVQKLPKLTNPDARVSVGKIFTDEEVSNLINFAQNDDLLLAIQMAATMGMRRSEIFALQIDRVDIENQMIRLKREDTKIRRARAFAIAPAALPELVKRCKAGSQWIFPSKNDLDKPLHPDGFKTAWANLKKTCGIEGRFHDLRHTFLTKAFKAEGANAAQICAYAGLSLQVAERVYLHLTEEDSRRVSRLVTYE
jgi:integrase